MWLPAPAAPRIVARGEYLERLGRDRRQRAASAGAPSRLVVAGGAVLAGVPCAADVGVATEHLAHAPEQHRDVGPNSRGLQAEGASKVHRQVKDNFVNRVVQRCGPAVVRVETEQVVEMPGVDNADLFSFFFGVRPDARKQERRVKGQGSGLCIDGSKGVVLTNAHVVQGADRIMANFPGLVSPLECMVLETDEVIDLAVIQVKDKFRSPLPAMPLGCSETVRTGDWAIVLGNPLGLQNTCTLGIVSSLDRSTGETGFDWMRHPLLQTDAAVNQGNSGGPLLNELGEVVGMISMRALFGEGIGFAIPIDSIKAALPSLLSRKKVPRAYLGLKMTACSPGSGVSGGRGQGAFVETVLPGSPADAAGFQVDDEIVEVNGSKVRHFDEVQAVVRSAKIGVTVSFKVKRGGRSSHTLSATAADIKKLREGSESRPLGRSGQHRVIVIP